MLYRLTALLLIPLLLGVNLSRMMVFAGFAMNRSYIASKLCENRDRPWMHCEGKCYLAKKLKQVEEKEKKHDQEVQKNLVQDSFIPEHFIVYFGIKVEFTVNTPYTHFMAPGFNAPVFQPPKSQS